MSNWGESWPGLWSQGSPSRGAIWATQRPGQCVCACVCQEPGTPGQQIRDTPRARKEPAFHGALERISSGLSNTKRQGHMAVCPRSCRYGVPTVARSATCPG